MAKAKAETTEKPKKVEHPFKYELESLDTILENLDQKNTEQIRKFKKQIQKAKEILK